MTRPVWRGCRSIAVRQPSMGPTFGIKGGAAGGDSSSDTDSKAAMACGCPVVTATTSACPEVAGGAALLVDPDDVAGLAAAMERVSLDDGMAAELRRRKAELSAWMVYEVSKSWAEADGDIAESIAELRYYRDALFG